MIADVEAEHLSKIEIIQRYNTLYLALLTIQQERDYYKNKFEETQMNTTPNNITDLAENEIFVFGSNQSGRHGKGAAKTAMKWGAVYGQAEGLQGRTYGIPTVDGAIRRTLSVEEIKPYVDRFITFAKQHPELIFLVTEIGCGLAGKTHKEMAPLFADAKDVKNIYLPFRFRRKI